MRTGRTSDPAVEARTLEALARFEAFLRHKDLRLTEARAAIVEAALARSGHYPIDALVADLKARGIQGSKATVYRALPLLAEAGILQPALVAGEARSYETTFGRDHHDHLVCRRCGKVVEFGFEPFEVLQRAVAGRHGFRLERHHHELMGTCAECQGAEGGAPGAAPAGPAGGDRVPDA